MLTTTRSGYAGALAGIFAVAALRSRRTLLAVGGVVAAILLFAVLYPPAMEALAGRGVSYRPGIWLRYIAFAWEDPWLGIGVFRRLQLTAYGAEFDHAHNLLISAQIRGGLLGLAGMALMLGGGLYWAWRYARRAGDPIVFGMMLALCVTGMFDYDLALTPLDWVWVTAWLPIGLAAGCELHLRRIGTSSEPADLVSGGASRSP
jgi:O-antigen ligase